MIGILKNSRNEHYGDIGKLTPITYKNGVNAKIGDVVRLSYKGVNHGLKFIVEHDYQYFVMGLRNAIFKNGQGTKIDDIWTIEKVCDCSEIVNGTKDSIGIFAEIYDEEREITHKNNDLLYFITSEQPLTFNERKEVEKMFDSNIVILNSSYVESAKVINKRTGEVIDLLK